MVVAYGYSIMDFYTSFYLIVKLVGAFMFAYGIGEWAKRYADRKLKR